MEIFNIIKDHIKSNYLYVVIILIIIIVVAITSIMSQSSKSGSSDLTKQLDRSDFTVKKVLKEKDGWLITEVQSSNKTDTSNIAYVIVYKKDGKATIKLGPGTYFSRYTMTSAGIPYDIQEEIQTSVNSR